MREAFIARARIFGQLRYLSVCHGWQINFHDLSPYRFADSASWIFDEAALLAETASRVPGLNVTQLQLLRAAIPDITPWSLMHGKDSLCVLAVGLRQVIGKQSLPVDRLAQMLRLAFDEALLRGTQVYRYRDIKAWEDANSPYRVLLS